jgi:serine/threonine protein kinase
MIVTDVYTANRKKLSLISPLGKEGGEGIVYLAHDNTAVKIFNNRTDKLIKDKKIDLLIQSGINDNALCIPFQKIFNNDGSFIGYNMSAAKGDTIQVSVFIRTCLERKFPHWNRINLCNLAISLLNKIQHLHSKDIIIGDLNPYNIMINNDDDVYFIDTDSYQIKNYPCTVGTILFTPPELQGCVFKETLRTKENEYFSIAILLFMIFLPGKNPFAYCGDGDLGEKIKAQNFSYPLGEDDNLQAPKGVWEYIWNELSYDIRRAFHDVFKLGIKINIHTWKNIILSFKEDLQKGHSPKDIFPLQLTQKQRKYFALSLNQRNIHESNLKLRNDTTGLSLNDSNKKIGVLELSTTSVKLLMGEHDKIKNSNFDFNHYTRASDRPETGSLLDSDCVMDMNGFINTVLPCIQRRVAQAEDYHVDVLYTVATAAYRTAFNRNQIIDLIKRQVGINVKILTKKEEALATLKAFFISKPKNLELREDKNYMFIDQGGGSTEITIFKGLNIIQTYSLNLGSIVLKNIFFKEATDNTTFDKAFKDSEKLIKDRLRVYLRSYNYNPKNLDSFCISVGNAIIQATGGKTTYQKHGVTLNIEDIRNRIAEFDSWIKSKYDSISQLYDGCEDSKNAQANKDRKSDQVVNILISRLSLPMYIEIMEHFKIEKVVVSNTGLFYGIFFEKTLNF